MAAMGFAKIHASAGCRSAAVEFARLLILPVAAGGAHGHDSGNAKIGDL
jgi:hypothetical protein